MELEGPPGSARPTTTVQCFQMATEMFAEFGVMTVNAYARVG